VNYVFGGKGGNQAVAADQNGARTYFAGRIGKDQFGAQILERLRDTSINVEGLQQGSGASGMSVAIIDKNGDYGAAIVSGENLSIDAEAIIYPSNLGVLLLQNEIDEKVNIAAARRAKELNASVWLNAAPARLLSSDLLELVDVMIVNRVEAAVFEKQMLKTLTKRLTIIKTLGKSGVVVYKRGQEVYRKNAFSVEVQSTHGAGDMFTGALAASYLVNQSLERAIDYAQAAAALHVSCMSETRRNITPEQVRAFTRKA
jgi:ribokinase